MSASAPSSTANTRHARRDFSWIRCKLCGDRKRVTSQFRFPYSRVCRQVLALPARVQTLRYELNENGPLPDWYRANHRTPWVATLAETPGCPRSQFQGRRMPAMSSDRQRDDDGYRGSHGNCRCAHRTVRPRSRTQSQHGTCDKAFRRHQSDYTIRGFQSSSN